MKHNRRRSTGKPRVSPTVLDRINPNVAGIDCGAAEHFVAVPPDRDPTPVQSFKAFTSDLLHLADWLTACRVTSVAMEATGVYWIPIYEILEARGFDVLLVNARHLKNVPGRKSDVSDAEWLRELHSVGLLRASFRPPDAIVALRAYLRHRQTLIESAGTYVQRMQKALVHFGGALGAILDGCSSPTSPSNVPSLPTVNGTRVSSGITLTIDASSPLSAVGTAALVQTSIGDFLVAHTAQSSFVALSAICTHQTCTVTGFGNQNYVCPCHGSTFDVNGRVLGGPAPASLHQYPTQFTNGVLTITA